MTTQNVTEYRGEPGTRRNVAVALMGLPLVEQGDVTVVEFPAIDVVGAAGRQYTLPGRTMRGLRHPEMTSGLPLRIATGLRGRAGGTMSAAELRGGTWHHQVTLTPGSLQFSTKRIGGWEAPSGMSAADEAALVDELAKLQHKIEMMAALDSWEATYVEQDRMLRRCEEIRELLGVAGRRKATRGQILGWSTKSQRRMMRRIASFDWSTYEEAGWIPAMVTLTYPGEWLQYVPDGGTAKRHLRSFRAWYNRQTDGRDRGLWKLEFQGRGAPHFHLLLPVPAECFARPGGVPSFADECRAAWWRIISADVALEVRQAAKHVKRHPITKALQVSQGVSIDVHEGARMLDPKRIAIYFAKHGHTAGKAYQHIVPAAWLEAADSGDDEARPGRWWGYWRMEAVEYSGKVEFDDTVLLRRVLRGYVGSQRRVISAEVKRHRVVIDTATGEISRRVRVRRARRRYRVPTLGHPVPTGFLLVNDAPSLARQLGRLFDEPDAYLVRRMRGGQVVEVVESWPAGSRRSLP